MLKGLLVAWAIAAASPAVAKDSDPLSFWTGRTQGAGSLKIVMKPSVPVLIDTRGTPDGRGGIVLEQIVREGSKPARLSRWVIRPTSPTAFTGTVTDCVGLIRGTLNGRVMRLHYRRNDGTHASHVLTLQPDGRTMTNRMTIKRLGLVVAKVEEVIRKLD